MEKQNRQYTIREILGAAAIGSQGDLQRELRRRGISVTQATLSRDLKEMGVGRFSSGERPRYTIQHESEADLLRPVIGRQVTSVVANESMIVIRTLPGSASVIGEYLDALNITDILGTLAGDNVLLVIPQSVKKTQTLLKTLKSKLIEGQQ